MTRGQLDQVAHGEEVEGAPGGVSEGRCALDSKRRLLLADLDQGSLTYIVEATMGLKMPLQAPPCAVRAHREFTCAWNTTPHVLLDQRTEGHQIAAAADIDDRLGEQDLYSDREPALWIRGCRYAFVEGGSQALENGIQSMLSEASLEVGAQFRKSDPLQRPGSSSVSSRGHRGDRASASRQTETRCCD